MFGLYQVAIKNPTSLEAGCYLKVNSNERTYTRCTMNKKELRVTRLGD
jgi:hypothetical protein